MCLGLPRKVKPSCQARFLCLFVVKTGHVGIVRAEAIRNSKNFSKWKVVAEVVIY